MLELFLAFAKCGLFTIGGGYAMIAVIEDLCVSQKKWLTAEEMMELIVIAESTPGPIAINCATYVGYRRRGIAGAVVATVGMVLPSFLIIYMISLLLDHYLEIGLISSAFRGMKMGVGIVILNAGFNMAKKVKKKILPRSFLLFGLIGLLTVNALAWNVSSIALMLAAGMVSLAVFMVKGGRGK